MGFWGNLILRQTLSDILTDWSLNEFHLLAFWCPRACFDVTFDFGRCGRPLRHHSQVCFDIRRLGSSSTFWSPSYIQRWSKMHRLCPQEFQWPRVAHLMPRSSSIPRHHIPSIPLAFVFCSGSGTTSSLRDKAWCWCSSWRFRTLSWCRIAAMGVFRDVQVRE